MSIVVVSRNCESNEIGFSLWDDMKVGNKNVKIVFLETTYLVR